MLYVDILDAIENTKRNELNSYLKQIDTHWMQNEIGDGEQNDDDDGGNIKELIIAILMVDRLLFFFSFFFFVFCE